MRQYSRYVYTESTLTVLSAILHLPLKQSRFRASSVLKC